MSSLLAEAAASAAAQARLASERQRERLQLDQEAEASSDRLRSFVKAAWPVVEPVTPFQPNWHIDVICDRLEAVTAGEVRRLVVTIPPGTMKSLTVSVFWPAWAWTIAPHTRWLYASYAQSLSTRDSVRCRRVIESPWYRRLYGDRFRLTSDQNVKTRYENDRTGVRIATSVDGGATGERGDVVVCLPYETLISTDHGDLPIGRIVEERLQVRVLGSSGRLQAIEKYERNPGHSLIEIETSAGRSLTCTEEHPIWLENRGFRPAREVKYGGDGLRLRRLRNDVRPSASPRRSGGPRPVLLPRLLGSVRARQGQPTMGRRPGLEGVRRLRDGLLGGPARDATPPLLLLQVPRAVAAGAASHGVSGMPHDVHSRRISTTDLRPSLRGESALAEDARASERTLDRRSVADTLRAWLHKRAEGSDPRARRPRLRALLQHLASPGASHRPSDVEPRSDEPRDSLHLLPLGNPHEVRRKRRMDETVGIRACRSRPAPNAVYNLRVAPDHDYYADGFLVHNCDDPHKIEEADSLVIRQGVLDWWDQTMSLRLNDPQRGAQVLVQQRVHERDLAGHLIEKGWEVLCLPMEHEPGHPFVYPGDPRQAEGELLFPARFGPAEIEQAKADLGSRGYAGQYQQRPAPAEGTILKRHWWRYYDPASPPHVWHLIQSWDTAFKDKTTNDWVVGLLFGGRGADWYLLRRVRGHWDLPETKRQLRAMTAVALAEHGAGGAVPQTILVENRANGPDVIAELRSSIAGLIPVNPKGDKTQRAHAVTPMLEAGNVWLPGFALHGKVAGATDWDLDEARSPASTVEFVHSCAVFPAGEHDDDVDALTQALSRARMVDASSPPGEDDVSGKVDPSIGYGMQF